MTNQYSQSKQGFKYMRNASISFNQDSTLKSVRHCIEETVLEKNSLLKKWKIELRT